MPIMPRPPGKATKIMKKIKPNDLQHVGGLKKSMKTDLKQTYVR